MRFGGSRRGSDGVVQRCRCDESERREDFFVLINEGVSRIHHGYTWVSPNPPPAIPVRLLLLAEAKRGMFLNCPVSIPSGVFLGWARNPAILWAGQDLMSSPN